MIHNLNLNKIIKEENLSKLDYITQKLAKYLHYDYYSDKFIKETLPIIKEYYKIVCKYKRDVFENQSTCVVYNDEVEETLPYKIGCIKAYCEMIFDKLDD